MFRFDPTPTFTHSVTVLVPVDGGHEEQSFDATFKVMPTDEAAKYDLDDGVSAGEFLRKVLVGVEGIHGPGDSPILYSNNLRDQMIAVPFIRSALARTYLTAVFKAALGN